MIVPVNLLESANRGEPAAAQVVVLCEINENLASIAKSLAVLAAGLEIREERDYDPGDKFFAGEPLGDVVEVTPPQNVEPLTEDKLALAVEELKAQTLVIPVTEEVVSDSQTVVGDSEKPLLGVAE